MKQPNFFIIGAPKCGTTSMAAWLDEHPHIFMSDPKEPSFFSTDIKMQAGLKTLNKYLQIFQNVGEKHLAVGEASITYLLSQVAVKNIQEFNPNAKFIVMLRNPIEMARSWHNQVLWSTPRLVLEDFEKDWKIRYTGKLKLSGFINYIIRDPVLLEYDKVCMLGEQVQRLLQTVEEKSVLFILMDDLIGYPRQEYLRVLEFLGVPDDGKTQFATHNFAKRQQNKLIRNLLFLISELKLLLGIKRNIAFGLFRIIQDYNTKPHNNSPLRSEFKQELIEFFKEDVNLLSSLLNRDLSHWLQ